MTASQSAKTTSISVRPTDRSVTISKHIYGHFSEHLGRCIYEGIWVGIDSPIPNTEGYRNDVLKALKELKVPVLRWPGGCFADEYHWMDGIGPYEKRARMVNSNWGGVEENNHFGTHEFLRYCELIGAEPYISGNLGSGTVQEMQQWVEYMTLDGESPMANLRKQNGQEKPWKLTFFGVGNENWGCGGNMRAQYYADEYKRYATYVRNYSSNQIYKIACGPSADDYNWTEVLMREAGSHMHGLSLHYYTLPTGDWSRKGDATGFPVEEWFETMRRTLYMEEMIVKHTKIMDKYDPEKRVGLLVDEWGTWYDVESGSNPGFLYQQNTLRDALVAGINLNLFHEHADRVRMANIAQVVNVLQAMILTEGEKMILTPTYHVFNMFKVHQDAELLPLEFESPKYTFGAAQVPQLSASASRDKEGKVHLSLCNLHHEDDLTLSLDISTLNVSIGKGQVLTHAKLDAHNDFSSPDVIKPAPLEGIVLEEGTLRVTLPAASVAVIELTA